VVDLIKTESTKTSYYVVDLYLKSLEDDVEDLKYFKRNWIPLVKNNRECLRTLLIGSTSSFTELHVDVAGVHSYINVIKGRKIVFFFPQEEDREEIVKRVLKNGQLPSNISKEMASILNELNAIVYDVNEGDTLFIPSGWFHIVRNLEMSIAWGDSIINSSNILKVAET